MGVQTGQDGAQFFTFGTGDQIDLADEDHVSEFHLLNQQVSDRALILFAQGFATTGQRLGLVKVAQEVDPVDYRDHGVQPCQVGETLALLVAKGEGLGHRQGLGNAG